MKRIVFLDYVRVFACFLVMLVHASENYYGAPGSTDMAGPQSFLLTEADRLWVSVYDGFSRMAVPLFMIVSAFLLVPMREGQGAVEFYRRRAVRILPAFVLFMVIYSTGALSVGPNRYGDIAARFMASAAQLSHPCRASMVYVPFD